MNNISTKINLRRLKSAVMNIKGKDGNPVKCLVLPIAANSLYESEKQGSDSIYLDLIGFELRERKPEWKHTHIVKQSLSKETLERMSEAERNAMPIIGSHTLWGEPQEAAPNNFFLNETEINPADRVGGGDGDLPF